MKIYTKTGDEGQTHLINSERVMKNNPRIKCCGELDELNCQIGIIVATIRDSWKTLKTFATCELTLDYNRSLELKPEIETLEKIQNELFVLGAYIACPNNNSQTLDFPCVDESNVKELENLMDKMDERLSPLKNFILPGGHVIASNVHLARAIARRAERAMIEIIDGKREYSLPPFALQYINRLSDYFFVLARYINFIFEHKDKIWTHS